QSVASDNEPVADIRVRHSPLKGIHIPQHLVPIAIDEFPVIMIAAANASGETILSGADELRVKESDRIEAIASGLTALGIKVTTRPDGMTVSGGVINGGEIDSCGDHRIAMAFSIAAINAKAAITIRDCINVNTSFPGFVDSANGLGCHIVIKTGHV
ncbi:MAG: 3-phosphoshikimate 1-carboxyvinyltransferase, partial [Gammaproteobacteria bacterium]|nr:3-phosphoshikimate 1-carboxyvinyltransferase [Gammaproteobacteria bacterium]